MDPELMTAFKDLDLNGDGFLSMEELKQGFEKYGQKWDEAEEERYKNMDENGDGKVSLEGNFFWISRLFFPIFKFFFLDFLIFFSEYLLAFQKELEAEIRKEMAKFYANMKDEMIEAFKKMDEDGNGFLSKEEIQKVLEENCEKWGYFDEDMFNKLDENDDGKISTDGIFFFFFVFLVWKIPNFFSSFSEFLAWALADCEGDEECETPDNWAKNENKKIWFDF